MSDSDHAHPAAGAPTPNLWSRDGFTGSNAIALRNDYTPTYRSVRGPHAPHRFNLLAIETQDQSDAEALPTPVLVARNGLELAVSHRRQPMPYALRNTEGDELHLVQSGSARFVTDFGTLEAGPLDFVHIPRSITYRIDPLSQDYAALILTSPDPLRFDTPAPFGMINFGKAVRKPSIDPQGAPGTTRLCLRTFDGVTEFDMVHDPIRALAQVGGPPPVWALNLRDIVPVSYGERGGPPAQFLSTADTDVMAFTLSARPGPRPPVHVNADYDEIILFAEGPGAWGGISEPGTVTWVPKGVTHHGPVEDVPAGYQAWLLEVRQTMRLTDAARQHARLIETSEYGYQD
ncbi:homogentisate 1,2-dioxygenase [Novosphingobium sp. LASN5T]|uniref:homogentisate 1,2-dioxygenase n=1 Tax=Novosphingobium sp. LASN5T TaxID=2491021 RepID=UPI000F5E7160|nr:homogentisate 1,2-dioxygenase [Novosphingobium sp. LASN5T]RQW41780.1 homogentisate 1,2-dioxygenase [Novosphingobium sp. LASN5T]